MDDIVKKWRLANETFYHDVEDLLALGNEAADEIEVLRARNAALEAQIKTYESTGYKKFLAAELQAVERHARAEALKPYAGMLAVPAPIWVNGIAFIKSQTLGSVDLSDADGGEKWRAKPEGLRDYYFETENEAREHVVNAFLISLGGKVIEVE